MDVLEKIIEEIEEYEDNFNPRSSNFLEISILRGCSEAKKIIRSHMDEIPKCDECSRRKFYKIGFDDGVNTQSNNTQQEKWIPVNEQLPEEREDVLVWYKYQKYGTYNTVFEAYGVAYYKGGKWYLDADVEKARCIAWRPLPEPYKGE